jgi:sirohydrochlorin ferrochelatase
MNDAALFLVTHGSSDRRSWLALQNLITVARSQITHLSPHQISGGCLEGQELSLAQQLIQFGSEVMAGGISEIIILPLFLLEGVHVSEDIPAEVAIAKQELQAKFPRLNQELILRTVAHLGTNPKIPNLLKQHFVKHSKKYDHPASPSPNYGRILIAHGSRRAVANQVVESLAAPSQAVVAYWGVEPKIETQIENLIAQGISLIDVLPYFLTSGGITEAIAKRLQAFGDRAKIQLLPVPLSSQQIIDLSLDLAYTKASFA